MPRLQEPKAKEQTPAAANDQSHATAMVTLLSALTSLKRGKSGVRLPIEWTGVEGKVADAFNEVVELNERMAGELARLRRVAGKEGKLAERMSLSDIGGFWEESARSVNSLIDDLVHPDERDGPRHRAPWLKGDLSQTMALEVDGVPLKGEFLKTARTINTMVDQAQRLCVGSKPRGSRSGNGRKTGRAGSRAGRCRNVERPH